jgi:hypothetical protein
VRMYGEDSRIDPVVQDSFSSLLSLVIEWKCPESPLESRRKSEFV